jgi:hypothetical protein
MSHWAKEHEQEQVKINKYVDKGVASLVVALNEYESVITLDSCEKSRIHGSPHVSFLVGCCEQDRTWQKLGVFMDELKGVLDKALFYNYSLHLMWPMEDNYARADLIVKPGHVSEIAEILSKGAQEVNQRRRMSGSVDGNQRIELGSC